MELALSINTTPLPLPTTIQHISGGLSKTGANAINLAINLFFVIALVLGISLLLYSGIQWILSGGDKQKLQNARSRLTYTIVGIIIVALSFLIVNTVITLLGGNPKFFLTTP